MAKSIDEIIELIESHIKGLERRAAAGREAIRLLRNCKFGDSADGGPRYPGDPGDSIPEPVRPEDRLEPSRTAATKPPQQRA